MWLRQLLTIFLISSSVCLASAIESACLVVPVGNEQVFSHKDTVEAGEFSPDGKWAVSVSSDKTVKIVNLAKQTEQILDEDAEALVVNFAPDSQHIVVGFLNGMVKLLTLNGENFFERDVTKHWDKVTSVQFSPDAKRILTASVDGKVKLVDFASGKQAEFDLNAPVMVARLSSDGNLAAMGTSDGLIVVRDLQNGKVRQIQHEFAVNSLQFSRDGLRLLSAANDMTARVISLTGPALFVEKTIRHSNDVLSAQFSPDDRQVITASADKTAKIVDLSSGAERVIEHLQPVVIAEFSPDGKKVLTASRDSSIKITDLINHQVMEARHRDSIRSAHFSFDGKKIISVSGDRTLRISDLASICISQNEILSHFVPAASLLSSLKTAGSFRVKKDLLPLLAVLNSAQGQTASALINKVFPMVLERSNKLYEYLIEAYRPLLEELPIFSQNDKTLTKTAVHYLEFLIKKNSTTTTIQDWSALKPLAGLFTNLSEKESDRYHDIVAQSLADSAAAKEFKRVYLSKLYKLAFHATYPLFGKELKPLTMIALVRTPTTVDPIIFGTFPIDSIQISQTPYGFFAKRLASISLPSSRPLALDQEIFNDRILWQMGEKNFSAQLSVKALSKKSITSSAPSPDYDSLWADKGLVGLVIAGSSLTEAQDTIGEYAKYYKQQGFKFGPKKKIMSLKNLLFETVASGEVDYLIKEAHADGDEANLFRVNLKGEMVVGSKTLKDGRFEKVYLIFPDLTSDSELLSNSDFGEWIRQRETSGKGPLIYFNTSCWSATKAVSEIQAAQSAGLVDIPLTTPASQFVNEKGDAIRTMLESLRQGKTYEEMRQLLSENKGYSSGTDDHYIFPDEEDYGKEVYAILTLLLDMKVKIFDETGAEYVERTH